MSFVNSAYLEQYRAAAGEGAVIELKMRLLADKHPALQSLAHAQKLEEIETKIVAHFKDAVSDEDKENT